MKNQLKIFYVSSEVSPFTQTGELGEISGALPKYLKSLGHEIRLMMPNYKSVNERKYILRDVIRLQGLEIKMGDEIYNANAKSAFIPDSKVQIYFLDNKFFFDRDGLYYDKHTGKEFNDNALRFIFFSLGCLETLKLLYWQPDIIHCNDWQTALIPILLKTAYQDDTFFKNTKTLLSIHNYANQGHFDSSMVQETGLLDSLINSKEQLNNNMDFNFLEVGLENADLLTTVSYPFMNENQDETKNSIHLKEILTTRKNDVFSIINGIDEQVWNPEIDTLIPFNYSRRDLSNKVRNKRELLNRFKLDAQENSVVISMISHFCDDKCFELLLATIEQILKTDSRLIILANYEDKYQSKIKVLQKKYLHKLGVEFNFNASLKHLVMAGSDMFLIPLSYESSHLYQFYSLAYGTIPVVKKWDDSVKIFENFNLSTNTGNAFIFNKLEPKEISNVIKKALKIYQQNEVWEKVIQNAMKLNFSWKTSAQQYVKLYQKLMMTKRTK